MFGSLLIYPGICPCSSSSSWKTNQKSRFPGQVRWDHLPGVPVMDGGEFWFRMDPPEDEGGRTRSQTVSGKSGSDEWCWWGGGSSCGFGMRPTPPPPTPTSARYTGREGVVILTRRLAGLAERHFHSLAEPDVHARVFGWTRAAL